MLLEDALVRVEVAVLAEDVVREGRALRLNLLLGIEAYGRPRITETAATTAIQNNVSVFPVGSSATGSLTGSMSLGSSFRTLFTARLTG